MAEPASGKGVSIHLHGCHPLQSTGGPPIRDESGLRGFGDHHGWTEEQSGRMDRRA